MLLSYQKNVRFEALAVKIRDAVTRYWNAHALPLGWRYAVSPFMNQLKAEHREEFKQFLIMNRYVHEAVAAKTGSRYLFPPLSASDLNEDTVAEAMSRLADVQRLNRNRNERERTNRIATDLVTGNAVPMRRSRRGSGPPPSEEAS